MHTKQTRDKELVNNVYFKDAHDFMDQGRGLKFPELFEIEDANKCVADCNYPVEKTKKLLTSAFKDINLNFSKCLKANMKREDLN